MGGFNEILLKEFEKFNESKNFNNYFLFISL